jgi:hypothetical protein
MPIPRRTTVRYCIFHLSVVLLFNTELASVPAPNPYHLSDPTVTLERAKDTQRVC